MPRRGQLATAKELALDDDGAATRARKDAPWTRLVSGTMSKRSAHWAAEESIKCLVILEAAEEEDLRRRRQIPMSRRLEKRRR